MGVKELQNKKARIESLINSVKQSEIITSGYVEDLILYLTGKEQANKEKNSTVANYSNVYLMAELSMEICELKAEILKIKEAING